MEILTERAKVAKRLVDEGDDVAATALCTKLWSEDQPQDASGLAHFVLPTLISRHRPAREAFTRIRDELESQRAELVPRLRWMQLSYVLDDGLPVLRWLASLDPTSDAARGLWSDDRIHHFVAKHDAWRTFARLLNIDEIDEDLSATLEDLAEHSPQERRMLFPLWMEPFEPVRRALLEAGRIDDEARLAARIGEFCARAIAMPQQLQVVVSCSR